MIESPTSYQNNLTDADYQMIGTLAVSWATTEHVIGNCLKTMMRLTDDEAQITLFPLGLERRISHMQELAKMPEAKWHREVLDDLAELALVMRALNFVRNNVLHAICINDAQGETSFHLRSKNRTLPKEQVLSVQELTNYAARVALDLRHELGFKKLGVYGFGAEPLPDRPPIPDFLKSFFPAKPR